MIDTIEKNNQLKRKSVFRTSLRWTEISTIALITIIIMVTVSPSAQAQYYANKRFANKNNPNYDLRKKLTYGFLIGLHNSSFKIKYADRFVTPSFDTVFAVVPSWKKGFALGFIMNYRVEEFLDIRITPQVGFYENTLTYRYTRLSNNPKDNEQTIETTMVELPILLKYKSERRGNIRMYMIGGIKPGIEASGKKDIDALTSRLAISEFNLSLEAGFGFDLYYPLFKFSPEIRFSHGLKNMLQDSNNPFGLPLKQININTVTVYLLFQ